MKQNKSKTPYRIHRDDVEKNIKKKGHIMKKTEITEKVRDEWKKLNNSTDENSINKLNKYKKMADDHERETEILFQLEIDKKMHKFKRENDAEFEKKMDKFKRETLDEIDEKFDRRDENSHKFKRETINEINSLWDQVKRISNRISEWWN